MDLASLVAILLAALALAGVLLEALERRRSPSAPLRAPALEGHTIAVTTPRPDDRTIRGVCTRELTDDTGRVTGVVLAAAVVLEEVQVGRDAGSVREVRAGDVVVAPFAWAQILQPAEAALPGREA